MKKERTITGAVFTYAHRKVNDLRKKINTPTAPKKGKKK